MGVVQEMMEEGKTGERQDRREEVQWDGMQRFEWKTWFKVRRDARPVEQKGEEAGVEVWGA